MPTCLLVTFCAQRKGKSIHTGDQTLDIQCNREEKNYKYSCKLNTKINFTTYSSFPSVAFYIWEPEHLSTNRNPDDEETTQLKVASVHWVDDGSLLRQLRKHYVSTWISPGMESNVSSGDSSRHGCFHNMANKNILFPFYSQTTIIKPFPDICKADTMTNFQPRSPS